MINHNCSLCPPQSIQLWQEDGYSQASFVPFDQKKFYVQNSILIVGHKFFLGEGKSKLDRESILKYASLWLYPYPCHISQCHWNERMTHSWMYLA